MPCARSAHGKAHQSNAISVDRVFLCHGFNRFQDVGFSRGLVAQRMAPKRMQDQGISWEQSGTPLSFGNKMQVQSPDFFLAVQPNY